MHTECCKTNWIANNVAITLILGNTRFKKKKVCISHIPNLCYTKGKLHFMEKQIISQLFNFREQNEHNMLADEKRDTKRLLSPCT